jgi:transposase
MEQANPAFSELYRLTVQLSEMLRKRQPEQVRPWLSAAKASALRELKSLAEGIARDYDAVEAALRLPYSTGPVEGNQVGSSSSSAVATAGQGLICFG